MSNPAAAELIARSNRLGADPRNTNYAGGNTSAKGTETDPVTGEPVELLWVKGSGGDLGTLTESGPRRAAPRPAARAGRRLPRRRARGRDGRGVRLLPARQGRGGAVDRHRHARPRRRRPRRPPAPRLRHRDRDGRRRRAADQGDLRRPGGLGAVAASRLPARPRHRRDQGEEPAGHRLHPRRPRHHRLGRHLGRVPRPARWRSSAPRRRTSPSTAKAEPFGPPLDGLRRPARPPSAAPRPRPLAAAGARAWPRPDRAAGRPLHRRRRRARLPRRAPSTRGWPRSAPPAPTTSCAPRSGRWCSTCRPSAPLEESIARLKELHAAYREDYAGLLRPQRRARQPRRCAAPTRRSCWCPASACSPSARTSRPPGWPASSTSTRST